MSEFKSTDEGDLVIDKEDLAVIYSKARGKLQLMIPRVAMADNDMMPPLTQYLTACFLRHDDEEFVTEQLEWLQAKLEAKRSKQ